MDKEQELRKRAIHLLRAGHKVQEVAQRCGRSKRWVYKCQARFKASSWAGLESGSRGPKKHGRKLSQAMRQAILRVRSELEAEAAQGQGLRYIGAPAIRTRLRQKRRKQIPSCATIERVLKEAGMTRPPQPAPKTVYPRLTPQGAQQLIQVDIVPHYLTGGERMPCFNAIDVVSRYPTGQPYAQRRALDAVDFLIHVWQEIGIPTYTQVDNEGCFSGGATHPYVLGKVVRLALAVGTQLLFSPVYHPQSNGYVERFHQDYNLHVWQNTYLRDRKEVRQKTKHFLQLYRQRTEHSALNGRSPAQVHGDHPVKKLDAAFSAPQQKLPLYAGKVHFMRRVRRDKTVSVLNVAWPVRSAKADQGVWVTLHLTVSDATLTIYNKAPDDHTRRILATHPFPLTESVLPAEYSPLLLAAASD